MALQLEVAEGMGVFVLLTMGVVVTVAVNGMDVFVLVMAGVALSSASTVCAAAVRLASSP